MKSTLLDPSRQPSGADFAARGPQLHAADAAASKRGHLDLRHLWHSLLEKLWIVVLCVLAGLFLGIGYYARTPNLYQGHIVLEVDIQEGGSATQSGEMASRIRTMFLATQEAMRTIEQNLVNRTLLARVVRAENLTENGGKALLAGQALAVSEAQSRESAPTQSSNESAAAAANFTPLEEALASVLSRSVKPVIRRGTRLIDVFVTSRDPAMAQRLAEAVGREYIRNSVERRATTNKDTLRYLLEEEERLKKNLQKSEAAVAEYKAKTPDALQLGGSAVSTGSQQGAGSTVSRGGVVEDKLQDLNTKLTAAKAERLRLEGELEQITAAGDNVDALLAFPSIASAPTVSDRRRELAQVQASVAAMGQRYKEKHPKMLAAQAALSEAEANLRRAVVSQPAVLRNTLEQARANEANLTTAVQEQEKAAVALNRAAIGYQELARQAETDRALYESVLRQIKEIDVAKEVKTNAVSIVEHAPFPRRPISPSPVKSVGLGLLLGLLAGAGVVYLTDAMDRSIKTVDEAEALFKLPVLGAVPEVKKGEASSGENGSKPDNESTYRLVAEAPEGPAAEAFRNLRASLSLLGPEIDRKVFIFTSAAPEEGKSFTSANYALSLAQEGHNVLLIDADLRRPTLHKIFQPAEAGKRSGEGYGIVDCLVGSVKLADAVRPVSSSRIETVPALNGAGENSDATQKGTLSLLAGGRRAPNPAELLGGSTFARLVDEAKRTYDRVVIDTAPVLAVSDTLLMVPHVQSVCMVVRASHGARNVIVRALRLLMGSGAHLAGIVLNRLPRQRGSSYYYYYASEGYGAGEGSYNTHYRPRVVEREASGSSRR